MKKMKKVVYVVFFAITLLCTGGIARADVYLDVPWISQLNTGEGLGTSWDDTMNCGPTALTMGAHYIRDFRDPVSQDIKYLDDWLYVNNLISAINNYNIVATGYGDLMAAAAYYYGLWNVKHFNNNDLGMLNSYLAMGYPVIIGVETFMGTVPDKKAPHFMLLTGIDSDYVYVNDPGRSDIDFGKTSYPISDFQASWATQNYCAIVFEDNYGVGEYADGWHDADVISYTMPPSQPFVDYYLNNGGVVDGEEKKGPEFFGYPSDNVHEHYYSGLWVQNYSSDYTLILNQHVYNMGRAYLGVVYSVHGHIKDYWDLHYMDLGAPVTNEYFYPEGTDDFVVQWFEPTDNHYIAVVYDNREGIGGGFDQYEQNDPGCPPYDQEYFDQMQELNCGYKSDGYGMGGSGEDPPDPDVPVADFSASPTSGIVPLTVTFTDASEGEITSWYWDFDDGRDSEDQNIGITFYEPGIYDVQLTVSGPYGSDSRVRTITVDDHPNPNAHFSPLMSGAEFPVNTYTEDDQKEAAVLGLPGGGFKIIWHSTSTGHSGWFGQEFDQYGNKAGDEYTVTSFADKQAKPDVAKLDNGNYIVVWHESGRDGSGNSVHGRLYDANEDPIGSDFQINTYTQYGQQNPSVDSLANGGFIVTWESWQDGSEYGIYGQRYDSAGSKVGSEFRVNTYINDEQARPIVAGLPSGGFVITWFSDNQDGSSWGIYGQVFDSSGNKVGSEFRANTYTNYRQALPRIAALSEGGFVIVWESDEQDGNYYGVYGQVFDEFGVKADEEFQINTYTDFSQAKPAVAALTEGGFAVAWESSDQDGSGYGIFGQLFGVDIVLPPNPNPDALDDSWWIVDGVMDHNACTADFSITTQPVNFWDVAFGRDFPIEADKIYRLKFRARAEGYSGEGMPIHAVINDAGPNYNYLTNEENRTITSTDDSYTIDLYAAETDSTACLVVSCGFTAGNLYFTDIFLEEVEPSNPDPLDSSWWVVDGNMDHNAATVDFSIITQPQNYWDIAWGRDFAIQADKIYRLKFKARAENYTGGGVQINAVINDAGPNYAYLTNAEDRTLTTTETDFEIDLYATETDSIACLVISCGFTTGDLYFSEIILEEVAPSNPDPLDSSWWVVDGDMDHNACTTEFHISSQPTNYWDIAFGRDFAILAGKRYRLSFSAYAQNYSGGGVQINAVINDAGPNYNYLTNAENRTLTTAPADFVIDLDATATDSTACLVVSCGFATGDLYFSDISLEELDP